MVSMSKGACEKLPDEMACALNF